jgi:dihydrofolate reductase
VVVLTNRALDDNRVEVAAGDVNVIVAKLAMEGVKRAYVDGGSVIRAFLAARLIDELTLSLVPVLLGEGVQLFEAIRGADTALELDGAESFGSGLAQLRYRVRRNPTL